MLRRIFALNYIDAFIAGIVSIAVPVMMLEYGIDLASIGLIFAIAPVVKLLVRLSSASLADRVGERIFYTLNAASNLAQAVCYAFPTALGFAAGKLFDGARESFIFAVNRTSILAFAPHKKHSGTAQLISERLIANAGGSLAVFLILMVSGFDALLVLIAILSIVMLLLARKIPNTHTGNKEKIALSDLAMRGKARSFYETLGAMVLGGSFYSVMFYLALPIFFKLNGFSLQEIGLMYAIYYLIFGVLMKIIIKHDLKAEKAAAVGVVVFIVALSGISFGGKALMPYFFILMTLADSCCAFLWEKILYLEAKHSKKVSTDIALLHMPAAIIGILAAASFGFVTAQWGFSAVFLIAAFTLAAYALWCVRLCGRNINALSHNA
ncbi:MAG: MFS transporter [Candidatus Micrarchaeota archaeon]|nr:MFS transporter [Candidatus Micrarchaeota archaeon]